MRPAPARTREARIRAHGHLLAQLRDPPAMLYLHEYGVLAEAAGALTEDDASAGAKRASAVRLLMVLVETGRWGLESAAEVQQALDACA